MSWFGALVGHQNVARPSRNPIVNGVRSPFRIWAIAALIDYIRLSTCLSAERRESLPRS